MQIKVCFYLYYRAPLVFAKMVVDVTVVMNSVCVSIQKVVASFETLIYKTSWNFYEKRKQL